MSVAGRILRSFLVRRIRWVAFEFLDLVFFGRMVQMIGMEEFILMMLMTRNTAKNRL